MSKRRETNYPREPANPHHIVYMGRAAESWARVVWYPYADRMHTTPDRIVSRFRPYVVTCHPVLGTWRYLRWRVRLVKTDGCLPIFGRHSVHIIWCHEETGSIHIGATERSRGRQYLNGVIAECERLNFINQLEMGVAKLSRAHIQNEKDPEKRMELIQAALIGNF